MRYCFKCVAVSSGRETDVKDVIKVYTAGEIGEDGAISGGVEERRDQDRGGCV